MGGPPRPQEWISMIYLS